jgi:hypothetical protein
MEDCELFEEVKNAESVSTVIHNARRVLKQELQTRCFTLRSSNSRMVQLYMSKQMVAKGMLTNDQYELARTLSTCSGCVKPTTSCNFRRVRVRLARSRGWVVPRSFAVLRSLKASRARLQLEGLFTYFPG